MNTNEKCGACGTPKSKNRFGDDDCPHCYSENFVGIKDTNQKKSVTRPITNTINENISETREHVEDIGNEDL